MSATKLAENSATLGALFDKVARLATLEQKEMDKVIGTTIPVLEWLGKPVPLRPAALGGIFAEFESVSLQSGAQVAMIDGKGGALLRPLRKFPSSDILAILREGCAEMEKMVTEKRSSSAVRPALSLKSLLD